MPRLRLSKAGPILARGGTATVDGGIRTPGGRAPRPGWEEIPATRIERVSVERRKSPRLAEAYRRYKKLLRELERKLEEARKRYKKPVYMDLESEWKEKILRVFGREDPVLYKCLKSGVACEVPGVSPVSEAEVQGTLALQKKVYGLAGAIKALASRFGEATRDNPAIQLAAYYNAYVDAATMFYRSRPHRLIRLLEATARDAEWSLALLKEALASGATEWSRKYCQGIEGCVTASKPVMVGGMCVRYMMIANKLPSHVEEYLASMGKPATKAFARIVRVPEKTCV